MDVRNSSTEGWGGSQGVKHKALSFNVSNFIRFRSDAFLWRCSHLLANV